MAGPGFDYHGALVVVETGADEIVLIHPVGATPDAPASLPSDPCAPGESPEAGAVRIVHEKTGLDVELTGELVTFVQEGTPTGTMCAHGYVARVVGGTLLADGPEGPARSYRVDALPRIVPVRVANQRVLAAYLDWRRLEGDQDPRRAPAVSPMNAEAIGLPQPLAPSKPLRADWKPRTS